MRTGILSYLTAQLTGSIKTSQELPFGQDGRPLYLKNLRRLYLDQPQQSQEDLYSVFGGSDVFLNTQTMAGYLAVDAKNLPSGLDSTISTILSAKTRSGITNCGEQSDYTIETQEDTLIYTFEFRLQVATT